MTVNQEEINMDLVDESTVYTTETKNTSLTPLYAILQAKDHETERITQNQIQAQDQLIDQGKPLNILLYLPLI